MKKLSVIFLSFLLLVSLNFSYPSYTVNAKSSYTETPTSSGGKIIEWSSNTYVQYWWESDKPDIIMYTSEFTGGIVKQDKQRFFDSNNLI